MGLEAQITVLCTDMGAAQALLPVVQELSKKYSVNILTDGAGKAQDALKKAEVPFTLIGKDDELPVTGGLLLTGTTPAQYKDGQLAHYGREAEAWKLAHERKIPSMTVLDKYTPSESKARFTEVKSGELVFPELILLPNQYSLNAMTSDFGRESSFEGTGLMVTGNPNSDSIKEKVRNAKRAYVGRIVPIFMSSQLYMKQNRTDNSELLKAVYDGVGDLVTIVVTAHPKDTDEDIESYKKFIDSRGVLLYKKMLDDLPKEEREKLSSRDLAFSLRDDEFCVGVSTGLLEEATLADKLALVIQPGLDRSQDAQITNVMGVTPAAYNRQEGIDLIKQALHDESFRNEWRNKRASYTTDGKATERVLEQVERVLGL